MTGPQKYPGASTAHWYQGSYPGSKMESNVVVLHTTEGASLPSYDGGASAPNLTAVPDFAARRLRWYQHFDVDVSSRALVNARGGVETNTLNALQVELTGTCDPAHATRWGNMQAGVHYVYWPSAPDWALRDLADFLRWCNAEHGIPLQCNAEFAPYPSSYGASNVRMTGAQWRAYTGICGHMHVPENVHGDPGAINIDKILAYARGESGGDNEMPPKTYTFRRTEGATLSPGTWHTLTFDEYYTRGEWHTRDSAQRVLWVGAHFVATARMRISGIAPGTEVQLRFSRNDKRDGTWRRSYNYGIHSPVHAGGALHVTHTQNGENPGSNSSVIVAELLIGGDQPATVDQVGVDMTFWETA